jgi:NADPH-dependent 2,4-dienoyl-CoA reductase/sulfur reductase-like enzyme/pSer/pThr/pTyr-binding forkhead associated (FHA) protein
MWYPRRPGTQTGEPDRGLSFRGILLAMARKRYVILGDGAAGMTAAQTLRKADRAAEITLVSDDPNPAYFRAALTNYLLGELREEQIWAVPPSFYQELGLIRLLDRARAVDVARRRVILTSAPAPLEFDALLVATGARARPAAFDGATLPGVATLRTLQDVRWVLDLLASRALQRAVVVGGGPLALEWAHALKERGAAVTLLVREKRLLTGALDDIASDLLLARMRQGGLDVRVGEEVRAATPGPRGHVGAVVTKSGQTLPCELCAIAIGVVCNTEPLSGSGVALGARGGVVVDERMQSSVSAIFAAGDCAELRGKLDQKWEPARLQGQVAAANMAGGERAYAPGTDYFATRLYDLDFASVGVIEAGGRAGFDEITDHKKSTGRISYRKLVFEGERLRGALMLGERKERVRLHGKLFKRLIDEGLDVRAIKPDLLDPVFDLPGWLRSKALVDPPKPARAASPAPGGGGALAVPTNAVLLGTRALDVAQMLALREAAAALPAPGSTAPGAPAALSAFVVAPPLPHADVRMLSIGLRVPERPAAAGAAAGAAFLELFGRRFDLGAAVITIGRDATCSIALADRAVSHLHAQITRHDGQLYLRDLGSSGGTWVGATRVTVPHLLCDGDQIRVGGTELTFRCEKRGAAPQVPQTGAPLGPRQALLEVRTGRSPPMTFELEGPSATIGRDPTSKIRIDDMSISRRHAVLNAYGGAWHISDLHSSRGTFRNGERLPPGQDVALSEGDQVMLGDVAASFLGRPLTR